MARGTSHHAEHAPGVVEVRLSGDLADLGAVAAVLSGLWEVLARTGPRPNRYDPGQRVYLTIRLRRGPVPASAPRPDARLSPVAAPGSGVPVKDGQR